MIGSTPIQSTYKKYASAAQVGMPGSTIAFDSDTGIAQDSAIGFGLAVCKGSDSDAAVVLGQPSGAGDFVGITMADNTLPNLAATQTDAYQEGENVGVLVKGDIWVAPQTNVDAGGAVYMNAATGQLGASGISNAVLIANAKWMTSYPMTVPGVDNERLAIVRLGSIAV